VLVRDAVVKRSIKHLDTSSELRLTASYAAAEISDDKTFATTDENTISLVGRALETGFQLPTGCEWTLQI